MSGEIDVGWPDGEWPVKLPNAELRVLETREGTTSSLSTFIWNSLAPGAEIAVHPPRPSGPGRVVIERARPVERVARTRKTLAPDLEPEDSDEVLLLAIQRAVDRLGTPAPFERVWALISDRGIDLPPAVLFRLLRQVFHVDDFGVVRDLTDVDVMNETFRPDDCRWDNIEQTYWELHTQGEPPYIERMYRKRKSSIHDGLEYHLDDIEHTLLTAEDEERLGTLIHEGQVAQEELRAGNADFERKVTLGLAIRAADEAREEFFLHNLRLVFNIAVKYRHKIRDSALGLVDLIQAGYEGLRRAVEKFDPTRGHKFSTYATWWIRQTIARQIADKGRTIRLPVHIYDKTQAVRRAQDIVLADQGRPASLSEIVDETGLTAGEVQSVLDVHEVVPLDDPDDIFFAATEELGLEEVSMQEMRKALAEALSDFDPRLFQVVIKRFGLNGEPPRTLEEIGEMLNVTRERIRQLEKKALKILNNDATIRRVATDWILPAPSIKQHTPNATSVDQQLAWERVRERARVIEALNRE